MEKYKIMRTYLITGVTGFVGRNLANKLLKENYRVVGIGRKDYDTNLNSNKNYYYLKLDLSLDNLNILDDFKINGIFHLASQQPSNKDITYEMFYKSNVESTINLIKYCSSIKLDFFAYTSTISIFGHPHKCPINEDTVPQPENLYSLTKFISEGLLKIESNKLDTKIIVLRLQSVFGNGDGYGIVHTFYEELKKNIDIELYSRGEINRNLVLIDDVVEVLLRLIFKFNDFNKFNIFNVASNNSLSTYEIATIVKDFLKSDANIICSDKKYIFDWDVFVDNSKLKSQLDFNPNSMENAIVKYLKQK